MPHFDFLLSGYYGFHNTGDEAILQSAVLRFKKNARTVAVLSHTPAETTSTFDVPAYDRKNEIIKAIRHSKVILSGGGGLFQDTTSLKSLIYYLKIPFLAKLFGKKTMIFAQGIGPIKTEAGKFLTRMLCNHFIDAITVRDEGSKKTLESIGVKKAITVTGDLAFLLPLEKIPAPINLNLPAGPAFVISLRDWPGVHGAINEFAKTISSFSKKTGATPILLPFQPNQDVEILRALGQALTVPHIYHIVPLPPTELLSIIQKSEMVIGMRFHSLVFAAAAGVPFVGIAYDEKVKHLADETNFPVLPLVELDKPELESILLETWNDRTSLKEKLSKNVEWIRGRSEKSITEAIKLLPCDKS